MFYHKWKSNLYTFLTPAFAFLLLFHFETSAKAMQPTCEGLFKQPYEYGKLKPDFKFTKKYTKEIILENAVTDQCSLQTCHLYAWTAHLESNYKKRTNENINLSEDYLAMMHWLLSSAMMLDKATVFRSLPGLGASLDSSRNLIAQYGLMPASAWNPKIKFNSAENVDQLNYYLQTLIIQTTEAIKATKNDEQKRQVLLNASNQLINFFEKFVGIAPEKFDFKGATYTPQEFQQKFFPEVSTTLYLADMFDHEVANLGQVEEKAQKKQADVIILQPNDNKKTVRLNFLEQKIMETIDSGQTVLLGYNHDSTYVDLKTGIMSISGFPTLEGLKPLTRSQRQNYGIISGHAVVIVGYDKDPKSGQLIKLKIRNSYGSEVGDGGYFHMYRDYFRAFVIGIAFN